MKSTHEIVTDFLERRINEEEFRMLYPIALKAEQDAEVASMYLFDNQNEIMELVRWMPEIGTWAQ